MLHRILVCDNGKQYIICVGDNDYEYSLYNHDTWVFANLVHDYYLEDRIKYNERICVGRHSNGELEYVKVLEVKKSSKEEAEDFLQSLRNVRSKCVKWL